MIVGKEIFKEEVEVGGCVGAEMGGGFGRGGGKGSKLKM